MERQEKMAIRRILRDTIQELNRIEVITNEDAEELDAEEYNKAIIDSGCNKYSKGSKQFDACLKRYVNHHINLANERIGKLAHDVVGWGYDPDYPFGDE